MNREDIRNIAVLGGTAATVAAAGGLLAHDQSVREERKDAYTQERIDYLRTEFGLSLDQAKSWAGSREDSTLGNDLIRIDGSKVRANQLMPLIAASTINEQPIMQGDLDKIDTLLDDEFIVWSGGDPHLNFPPGTRVITAKRPDGPSEYFAGDGAYIKFMLPVTNEDGAPIEFGITVAQPLTFEELDEINAELQNNEVVFNLDRHELGFTTADGQYRDIRINFPPIELRRGRYISVYKASSILAQLESGEGDGLNEPNYDQMRYLATAALHRNDLLPILDDAKAVVDSEGGILMRVHPNALDLSLEPNIFSLTNLRVRMKFAVGDGEGQSVVFEGEVNNGMSDRDFDRWQEGGHQVRFLHISPGNNVTAYGPGGDVVLNFNLDPFTTAIYGEYDMYDMPATEQ